MGANNSAELNFNYNENSRIGLIAKTLINEYKDNIQESRKAEIIIDLDMLKLERDEIQILESIILASGYTYYEVSEDADMALKATLDALHAVKYIK